MQQTNLEKQTARSAWKSFNMRPPCVRNEDTNSQQNSYTSTKLISSYSGTETIEKLSTLQPRIIYKVAFNPRILGQYIMFHTTHPTYLFGFQKLISLDNISDP